MNKQQTLTAQTFLSKLLTQYALIHEKTIGDRAQEYIKQIGIRTGEWMEGYYKTDDPDMTELSLEQYVDIILSIKNDIGGHFELEEIKPNQVVVKGVRCPFGDQVKDAPHLCQMTSSVFGGVAARHFGTSRVHLDKRIAKGDSHCRVVISINPEEEGEGDVYKDIPVTPVNGDPFQWEEETIKMLSEELRKSDEMITDLVTELEELRAQVRFHEIKKRRNTNY